MRFEPLFRRRTAGFTAIELMVVVAIVAILAALAGPSFKPLMERWRVRQVTEELQAMLYYARSEAIKRGGNITIAKASGGWSGGWQVSSGGTTLQQAAAPNQVDIQLADGSDSELSGAISVDRWGQLTGTGDSGTASTLVFRLMPKGTDTSNAGAAALCVRPGGRIQRLSQGSSTC
ncbi:Tfp pilus assembly protein FimT/FimU [Comamonas humi]